MGLLWLDGAKLNAQSSTTTIAERAGGAGSHHPMVVSSSASVRAMSGDSERRAHVDFDGVHLVNPRVGEYFNTLPKAAQVELIVACNAGGAMDRLLRHLMARYHALRAANPNIRKFAWQWTPAVNTFKLQRAARSACWVTWSLDGKSEIEFYVLEADMTFRGWSYGGAFAHPKGKGSKISSYYSGKIGDFLVDLTLAGAPADWKHRLVADINAAHAALNDCDNARRACVL